MAWHASGNDHKTQHRTQGTQNQVHIHADIRACPHQTLFAPMRNSTVQSTGAKRNGQADGSIADVCDYPDCSFIVSIAIVIIINIVIVITNIIPIPIGTISTTGICLRSMLRLGKDVGRSRTHHSRDHLGNDQ
jgi:hypothetical protein